MEDLEFKVNGYASTYLTLGWDDFINSPSKKSLEELKALNTEDTHIKHWVKPFPVHFLIKIINALIQVILGTWAYNDQDNRKRFFVT
ncbi:hypothetical protein [Flavobacterium sp.]|uniref:hypothetical protein n=1 Tax=Flavobacterium sp. TaxID=239 RepID=UPI0040335577